MTAVTTSDLLRSGERIDDLQLNGLCIIQNPQQFCFGIDAVLLSHFCRLRRGDRVADLGTGSGILPILLSAKSEAEHFTGIEIQKDVADMAQRSVRMNGLEDRIDIVTGDLCEASALLGKQCVDAVCANPPYYKDGGGIGNGSRQLEIARHEVCCTLEDVVREAGSLLKMSGRFFLVSPAARLAEAFRLAPLYKMEPKRLRLVHPFARSDANLFMMEAVKGGRPGLKVGPPLIVYSEKGIYSDEVKRIYSN